MKFNLAHYNHLRSLTLDLGAELSYLMKHGGEESLDRMKELEKEIKSITIQVSVYLDRCDLRMPEMDYPYDPRDKATWKYLENPKHRTKDGENIEMTMLNPFWIYKDLEQLNMKRRANHEKDVA